MARDHHSTDHHKQHHHGAEHHAAPHRTPDNHAEIGLIGLGVMGSNLALNIEEHGFSVAVYNRTTEKTQRFISDFAGRNFIGSTSLEEFVRALKRPRKILLMIAAGDPVDAMLLRLRPLLEPGDIVIDAGNSWFEDTQRRAAELADEKLHYVGMGVSGGEEGARHGPSLMPGGPSDAYRLLRPVLEAIAAKTDSGACVAYIGPGGSGDFVKMVHNGIEYGVMQLIAEAYALITCTLNGSPMEIAEIFDEWNAGALESFLIELTARVLSVRDTESLYSTLQVRREPASGRFRRRSILAFPCLQSRRRWMRVLFPR